MIYIVLPAFNEEETLPPLLDAIRENFEETGLGYSVIVVDDGSTDDTVSIAQKKAQSMPIELVRHLQNQGLADAIRTGLDHAVKIASPKDIVVTMDADNTHTPGLILRMVRMVREGYDVVIASRYRPGSRVIGVPLSRRFLSFGASVMFRLLFPMKGVKDYTSGYRAYRAGIIQEMFELYGDDFISESGFSCMVDILLKIRKHRIIAGEAPLILRYDLKAGESKMNVLKTVKETLNLMIRRLGGGI